MERNFPYSSWVVLHIIVYVKDVLKLFRIFLVIFLDFRNFWDFFWVCDGLLFMGFIL